MGYFDLTQALLVSRFFKADKTVDELKGDAIAIAANAADNAGTGPNFWMWIGGALLLLLLMLFAVWMFGGKRYSGSANEDIEDPLFDHDFELSDEFEVRDDDYTVSAAMDQPGSAEVTISTPESVTPSNQTTSMNDAPDYVPTVMPDIPEDASIATMVDMSLNDAEHQIDTPDDLKVEQPKSGFFNFSKRNTQEDEAFDTNTGEPMNDDHSKLTLQETIKEMSPEIETVDTSKTLDIDTLRNNDVSKDETMEDAIFAQTEISTDSTPDETPVVKDTADEADAIRKRYAFAAASSSKLAFSGISSNGDSNPKEKPEPEVESAKSTSYVAPIVRDDLEKADQRIDNLRLDMNRAIDKIKTDNEQLFSNNNNQMRARIEHVLQTLDHKMDDIAAQQTVAREKAIQPLAGIPIEVSSRISTLDGKLTKVSDETSAMMQQVNSIEKTMESQNQRLRAITRILDDRLSTVSNVYGEVCDVSEKMDHVSGNIAKLESAIVESQYKEEIAQVELEDIVKNVMSPDTFQMNYLLSNNNRADCVIKLPHPSDAIVVDNNFPMKAYDTLPTAYQLSNTEEDTRNAEDAFRRTILRYIVDTAERYVVPGETTNAVMVFVPQEQAYILLHNRFPDLVDDAYRANVWIVSPSTLIGTLQTLRGVLRDADKSTTQTEIARREARDAMAEAEELRAKAAHLAANFEQTQHELNSLLRMNEKALSRKHQDDPRPHQPLEERQEDWIYSRIEEQPVRRTSIFDKSSDKLR